MTKPEGTVTYSNKLVTQKKHDRAGLNGDASQGFDDNPNGNPSNSLGYKTPVGDTYERAVADGKAKANAVQKKGASNDPNASVMADRAKKLQGNPEKVREAVTQPAGTTTKIAQGNPDGDVSKRTGNSWGIRTKGSK